MNTLPLNLVDYIAIGGFLVTVIAVVFVARARSLKTYWANDRATGAVMLTLSTVATSVGSGMVFGIAAMAYAGGLVPVFLGLFNVVGLLLTAMLAPRLRALAEKHSMYSLPDFLGTVYSRRCKLIAALVNVLIYFFFLAAQIIALSVICRMITGLSDYISVGVALVLIVSYITLGGLRSDIIGDNIQFGILALLLVLFPVFMLGDPVLIAGFDQLPAGYLSGATLGGWSFILGLFLFFTPVPLVMTDIWMRIYSARSPDVARRSLVIAALLILPFFVVFTAVGIAAHILFPALDANVATSSIMAHYIPGGWLGLTVAGLLAAVVSTADSMALVTALTVSKDIIGTLSGKIGGDEGRLFVTARLAAVLVTIGATIFALFVPNIVQTMINAFSVLMILLPAVLGGMFLRAKDEPAAFWSIALGLGTTLGGLLVIPGMAFVPGVIVSLVVFGALHLKARVLMKSPS